MSERDWGVLTGVQMDYIPFPLPNGMVEKRLVMSEGA